MSALQTITDSLLVAAIDAATERVVLIAPGVWPPVATAISRSWQRLGASRVTVILDVDPEVCRIGYGSEEGLDIVQNAAAQLGESVGQEPGVRICVVISDQQTFVFSPNPRLVEAPPGEVAEVGTTQPRANGIVLSNPPVTLERELGCGPEGTAERMLGMEPLDQQKLANLKKDLVANPAKKFDLARAVSVYNAKVRFVEFNAGGYRVSQQTIALPKHLVSVVKNNSELARKIDAAVRLLDGDDALVGKISGIAAEDAVYGPPCVSQTLVERIRTEIEKKFLRPIKGVGKVIKRSEIEEFRVEVVRLESALNAFSSVLRTSLDVHFRKTAEEIGDAILPDILRQLPEKWRRQLGSSPNPEHVRYRIIDDLLTSFGDPEKRCENLKVSIVFKDVTYDMLTDPDFRTEIASHFPDLVIMEEYAAAKERPSSQGEMLLD